MLGHRGDFHGDFVWFLNSEGHNPQKIGPTEESRNVGRFWDVGLKEKIICSHHPPEKNHHFDRTSQFFMGKSPFFMGKSPF
jgi:hypothetical protein